MTTAELKQACLDLFAASIAVFDGLEQHDTDAPWEDHATLLALVKMRTAFDTLSHFFARQAAQRMLALGVSPEQLARTTYQRTRP